MGDFLSYLWTLYAGSLALEAVYKGILFNYTLEQFLGDLFIKSLTGLMEKIKRMRSSSESEKDIKLAAMLPVREAREVKYSSTSSSSSGTNCVK